jgi:PucR family transcriptional regulator, purine catabolism regulatory protein
MAAPGTVDVKSVLALDALKSAQVVAGAGGLSRPIRWVHIVDIPEVVEWVQEGNLLLTTAFAFRDGLELQERLVPDLAAKRLAGLIVAVGRYVEHLPAPMLAQGDALDFPLIELPWEVPFERVTRAVSEQIFARQVSLLTQSAQIHNTLTQLVLRGEGLPALASTLAALVGRSVTLEDPSFSILAYASCGPTDPVRDDTIHNGRTPTRVLQALQSLGVLDTLRRSARPVHVPAIPEVNLLYERIVMPIVAGGRTYGYAWIIAGDSPLQELDYTALEHGATVAALMMLQQRTVSETGQRLRGDLLDQLLAPGDAHGSHPEGTRPTLIEHARRLGYPLDAQAHSALLVRPQAGDKAPGDSLDLAAIVERALRDCGARSLVVARGDSVVALVAAGRGPAPEQAAEAIYARATSHGWPVAIGVGGAHSGYQPGEPESAGGVARSYNQAEEALSLSLRLHDGATGVYPFDSLGLYHWLHLLQGDSGAADNRYVELIARLARQDADKGSSLLQTLEGYLDSGGNALETARRFHLHRNTLGHRLQKIEQLCAVNLSDPAVRLNLQVALKFLRLKQA